MRETEKELKPVWLNINDKNYISCNITAFILDTLFHNSYYIHIYMQRLRITPEQTSSKTVDIKGHIPTYDQNLP